MYQRRTSSTAEKQYCLQHRDYTVYNRETTKFKTEKLHCLLQKSYTVYGRKSTLYC